MTERPLERCCICDDPTGNAGRGDGSLYDIHGRGPFCPQCWDELRQAMVDDATPSIQAENTRLTQELVQTQAANAAVWNAYDVAQGAEDFLNRMMHLNRAAGNPGAALLGRLERAEGLCQRAAIAERQFQADQNHMHWRESMVAVCNDATGGDSFGGRRWIARKVAHPAFEPFDSGVVAAGESK